jgi:2TM domain
MDYQPTPEGKDPQIWHLAHKRVAFKNHLAAYIVINLFFWMLWYFTGAKIHNDEGVPWPVWPMMGWGIGIIFHFIAAYVNTGNTLIEREYQKLKNQNH